MVSHPLLSSYLTSMIMYTAIFYYNIIESGNGSSAAPSTVAADPSQLRTSAASMQTILVAAHLDYPVTKFGCYEHSSTYNTMYKKCDF